MNQFAPRSCATNFIGIGDRECNFEPSTSGLYLSDLTGVNLELLSNLADGRYASATDYSEAILRRAILNAQDIIKQVLAGLRYQITQGAKLIPKSSFSPNTTPIAAAPRGLVVKKIKPTATFSAFFVESVELKFADSLDTTLFVKDNLGNILFSKAVSIQAGVVQSVTVLQEFVEDELYITIDNSALSPYLAVKEPPKSGCCGGAAAPKQSYSVSGWDGIQQSQSAFGMVLKGGLQCSFAQVICAILPYIAEAVLNLCEAVILQDIIASPRINYSTIYADAQAITTQISAVQGRAKKSIMAQVGAMLDGLKQQSPACISCSQSFAPKAISRV